MRGVKVTTVSGAVYRFDDQMVTREPGELAAVLWRDGEAIPVIEVIQLAVGWPMELVLDLRGDGVPTARRTNPVVSIEDLS